MSPTSRRRKPKKQQRTLRTAPDFLVDEPCDCPSCTGTADPGWFAEQLLDEADDFAEWQDPMQAAMVGAAVVAVAELAGDDGAGLVGQIIPALAATRTPQAMALLLAVASVSDGQVAEAAAEAATRLSHAGLVSPEWAGELTEPVSASDCRQYRDHAHLSTVLTCDFQWGKHSYTCLLSISHSMAGAASEIYFLTPEQAAEVRENTRSLVGSHATETVLDPAEYRWQAENAMNIRHAQNTVMAEEGAPFFGEDILVTEYVAPAVVLRAFLRALPMADKPLAPTEAALGQHLIHLMLGPVDEAGLDGSPADVERLFAAPRAKLPAQRKKSDGPAPVYQIKVTLTGAKPPIWRRLEVPADIRLDQLHAVIQTAFGWQNCHLHVFETPYGDFGYEDSELNHRDGAKATLEQVAPGARSKITYLYDFGDSWTHEILVEKVLDPDDTASYPRCTGGRRAGPPEDCGGVWGYQDMVDILADPGHPEHEDRLEWLGLDSADQFDPAAFDPATVNAALSPLQRR